jgi:CRISPR-associated protein Cmr2
MVMKSITMVTDKIKSFRRQALGDDSNRRLTARPYTWHEFAGLLNTVRAIKKANVPRSQLYRLRHTLDAEPGSAITPSVMEYLYTRTRINSAYGEALLEHIERPWCWETAVSDRVAKLPPWMPLGNTGWETIWADMLELYEMVPAEEAQ